jgi:hypothetical protein
VQVNIVQSKPGCLAGPTTGGIKEFQQGPVPTKPRVPRGRCPKETFHFLRRKDSGYPFPQLLAAKDLGQIATEDTLELKIAKKHFHRD